MKLQTTDEIPETPNPEKLFYGSDERGFYLELGTSKSEKGEKFYLRELAAQFKDMQERIAYLEKLVLPNE